jgi:hypothetical protein
MRGVFIILGITILYYMFAGGTLPTYIAGFGATSLGRLVGGLHQLARNGAKISGPAVVLIVSKIESLVYSDIRFNSTYDECERRAAMESAR